MKRFLIQVCLLLLAAVATMSATPSPTIIEISTSYPLLQSTVQFGGNSYPSNTVAYGPVGTPVVIRGSNFGSTGVVSFAGSQGTTVTVGYTISDPSSILVSVPTGAVTGPVTVTTGALTSNGILFIVTAGTSSCTQALPYSYRRPITISHNWVPNSDQINFPILVSGTYSFLATVANGGSVQNSNGYDIIFTSDPEGMNKLNYEVESYNPTTGAINVWVLIPLLSHTSDTLFYIQYGNSSITTSQANAPGVWQNGYAGVWHLSSNGAISPTDSTGIDSGTISNVTAAPGEIAGAGSFSGSTSSYIRIQNSSTFKPTGAITLEAWLNPAAVTSSNEVIGLDYWANGSWISPYVSYGLGMNNGTQNLQFSIATNGTQNQLVSTSTIPLNTWSQVVGTFDTSTKIQTLYINGASNNTLTNSGTAIDYGASEDLTLGMRSPYAAGDPWNGLLDEIRISTVARSADWIAAEYNNEYSPNAFYAVGGENVVAVTVSPATIQLSAGQTQQFTATVSGAANTAVTWSISPNIGSISSSGLFTAASTSNSQSITITATSVANSAQTASAVVLPPPIVGTALPNPATVGTWITITGAGFGNNQGSGQVTFNGVAAMAVSIWNNEEVVVAVPVGSSTGNLVLTNNAGASSPPVSFTVNTISSSPLLQLSISDTPLQVNLTSVQNLDWVHWGTVTDRKSGVTPLISNYTLFNGGQPTVGTGVEGYSWSDGTQQPSVAGTTADLQNQNNTSGFEISVPAGTTVETLNLYVVDFYGQGVLQASLSDGSAATISDNSVIDTDIASKVYSISFRAASAGQTLTVSYSSSSLNNGYVALEAATLTRHLPVVSVLAPVQGTSLQFPATVSLAANASQFDNPISSVSINDSDGSVFNTQTLPYAASWGPAASGHYFTTASASDSTGLLSTSNPPVELDVIGSGGSLSLQSNSVAASINLTTEGTADWVLWGALPSGGGGGSSSMMLPEAMEDLAKIDLLMINAGIRARFMQRGALGFDPYANIGQVTPIVMDHKDYVTPLISGYREIGNHKIYSGYGPIQFVYSDGTVLGNQGGGGSSSRLRLDPGVATTEQEVEGSDSGGSNLVDPDPEVTVHDINDGYEISVPAGTTQQTLNVYVGADYARGKLVAFLSDGSAPVVTDDSLNAPAFGGITQYSISYSAASAGQALVVRYTMEYDYGSGDVALMGADLSGSPETPNITGVQPDSGLPGTPITITGSGFGTAEVGSAVTFNGVPVPVTSWGDGQITGIIPVAPSGPGTYPLVIYGDSELSFTVTAPVISYLNPSGGPAGTQVVISGSSFGATQGIGIVTFNSIPATVLSWSDNTIVAVAPVGVSFGPVVVTSGFASNGMLFAGPPLVTNVNPPVASAGSTVTISGAGFGNSLSAVPNVTLAGVPAVVEVWNSDQIAVQVPAGATIGPVIVSILGESSNSNVIFGEITPQIAGINPKSGVPGNTIVISGTGFGSTPASVTIAGVNAPIISWSEVSISVTVPNITSSGPVIVTSGITSNAVNFTLDGVITGQVVQSDGVTPVPSAQVTISGQAFQTTLTSDASGNFSQAVLPGTYFVQASLAGAQSNLTSVNASSDSTSSPVILELKASQPITYAYDQLGRLTQVTDQYGNSAFYSYDAVGNILSIQRHTAAASDIAINTVTPGQGCVGVTISISGTGFFVNSVNPVVTFNGVQATVISATNNSITVTVPFGATTGTITVQTSAGSATSANSFTVLTSPTPISISGFNSPIAAPGTAVTISGTGFDPTAANDTVHLYTAATVATSATANSVTFVVPTVGTSRVGVSTTVAKATSSNYLFIPPAPYAAANVDYTGSASIGSTQTVSTTQPNDIAMLAFDVTEGQTVAISSASTETCAVTIYRPDGSQLINGDCASNANLYEASLHAGTYTYVVNTGTTPGSVTVTLNDATVVSSSITTDGTPVSYTPTVSGQNADFTFDAPAGQITIEISNNQIGNSTVELVDPSGTLVYQAQSCFGCSNTTSVVSVFLGLVSTSGVYHLRIIPAWGSGVTVGGSMSLSVLCQPTAVATANVQMNMPTDGTVTALSFVSPNETVALNFPATGGQWASIYANTLNPDANPSEGTAFGWVGSVLYTLFDPTGYQGVQVEDTVGIQIPYAYQYNNLYILSDCCTIYHAPLLSSGTYTLWLTPSASTGGTALIWATVQ